MTINSSWVTFYLCSIEKEMEKKFGDQYLKGTPPASKLLNRGERETEYAKNISLTEAQLYPNHPNPFNETTIMSFTIPERSLIILRIFNTTGQVIFRYHAELDSGSHEIVFDAHDLSSGIYFSRLDVIKDDTVKTLTDKMLLLK